MVAFYKEVCIIYGAEHPLHILWLYNFISGLVAQLGERSVRIREVKGSNPSVSTKSKIRTFVRRDRGSDFSCLQLVLSRNEFKKEDA